MPTEAEIQKQLAAQVAADNADTSVIKLDPKYDALSDELRQKLIAAEGKIANLDPETRAQLESGQANNEALLNRRFAEEKDDYMVRMFGQGRERSTSAADRGRMLLGDQGLALGNSRAAYDANVMNARMGLTQQTLQNYQLQGGNLDSARGAALQDNAQQAGQISDGRNRRANLLDSSYNRRSSERNTDVQASTARYGYDKSYDASIYGSDAQLAGQYASAAASRYGSDRQLEASRYSTDGSVRSAMLGANASMFGSQLGYDASIYGVDSRERVAGADRMQQGDQFNQNLWNDQYQFGVTDDRTRDQFNRDLSFRERDSQRNAQAQAAAQRQSRRSSLFSSLASFGGSLAVAAAMSDERLKDDIVEIRSALDKLASLRGVQWRWKKDGRNGGGVIAQEVEKVLPEAVIERASLEPVGDVKMVDYHAIIGLLVAAVNELQERVK